MGIGSAGLRCRWTKRDEESSPDSRGISCVWRDLTRAMYEDMCDAYDGHVDDYHHRALRSTIQGPTGYICIHTMRPA